MVCLSVVHHDITSCLPPQVLQRQETVFLYERKTSSQQPLEPQATPSNHQSPPPNFLVLPINIEAPPPSRQGSLSCLKGAEPDRQTGLLSSSPSESISMIPSSGVASQLSSPAGRDARDSHGRRGMMQAIKNERRASKVRIDCRHLAASPLNVSSLPVHSFPFCPTAFHRLSYTTLIYSTLF